MFEIVFYQKEDGTKPAKEFISSLPNPLKAKLATRIEILKEFGNNLREPLSKPLNDGIFELRTQLGNDNVRILYFFFIGNLIVLTNGFMKKTQKTPASQIELAKKYRKDFIEKRG